MFVVVISNAGFGGGGVRASHNEFVCDVVDWFSGDWVCACCCFGLGEWRSKGGNKEENEYTCADKDYVLVRQTLQPLFFIRHYL